MVGELAVVVAESAAPAVWRPPLRWESSGLRSCRSGSCGRVVALKGDKDGSLALFGLAERGYFRALGMRFTRGERRQRRRGARHQLVLLGLPPEFSVCVLRQLSGRIELLLRGLRLPHQRLPTGLF